MKLSPAQAKAVSLLNQATPDPDGYTGLMWTQVVYELQDGTAWIYFRTALALERKGVAVLDYRFGRMRLKEAA